MDGYEVGEVVGEVEGVDVDGEKVFCGVGWWWVESAGGGR